MKITGAEYMDWYDNHWPGDDWYIDESCIETHDNNGQWILDPSDVYDTNDFGLLFYQGDDQSRFDRMEIASLIRKHRKQRDYDVLAVTVPKTLTEQVKRVLIELGCKLK